MVRQLHGTDEHAFNQIDRGNLSKSERKQYIDAVLCLSKKPPITPLSEFPGVRSRYDDFVATHINQTGEIHNTVGIHEKRPSRSSKAKA